MWISDHKLYSTWRGMLSRCENPNSVAYKNYGFRGIKVCEAWHDFEQFVFDMEDKPTLQHSIERIDNDKGYCKTNCKWATWEEQAANRWRKQQWGIFGKWDNNGQIITRFCKPCEKRFIPTAENHIVCEQFCWERLA